jgi:hypothetical protein
MPEDKPENAGKRQYMYPNSGMFGQALPTAARSSSAS